MEIFSFEFFGILMLSIAILSMRARKKKKGSTVLGGKTDFHLRGKADNVPVKRYPPAMFVG